MKTLFENDAPKIGDRSLVSEKPVSLSLLRTSCNALLMAGRVTPNVDKELPVRTALRKHILAPICLKSGTRELAKHANSIIDNVLPMRMKLRTDIVVPVCTRPDKIMEFRTRACPITANELSKSSRDI